MWKWIIIILSTLWAVEARGQSTIKGIVMGSDSSQIVTARVELFLQADKKRVASTQSDKEGRYRFENIGKGSYVVQATALDCVPVKKSVIVWGKSDISIDFKIDDHVLLNEVKVVSNGISMRGDTTSYLVKHFTTGTENTLGDILGKLPNIQIDENAKTITANGKRVSRVLMEGQDLFQGNTTLPTENVSAKGVSRVDVIDNYSEYNIYDGFNTTNETVINVGVNNKMKGKLKGDLNMAGGVLNKFHVKNSSLLIGKKEMFSGILAANNIGVKHLTFKTFCSFPEG